MASIWGKLGGAGIGFAVGGPIGALIGALAGHYVMDQEGGLFTPDKQTVFTTGLVALSAKMAKADGVVTRDETRAFFEVVQVQEADRSRILKLFELANQTTAGYQAYARQIAELFADDAQLREDVVDGLFHIAKADGAVHEAELAYLHDIALILGFGEPDWLRLKARHVREPDDPYVVLGAQRDWDEAALRRLYRRLVQEYHPDRQIARGLPEEAVAIATSKLAAINEAWERIRRERGWS
ncbi:MAG: TerB family tellurite resistance protein [Alsobacter sp.]